jgi:hypothetical protein
METVDEFDEIEKLQLQGINAGDIKVQSSHLHVNVGLFN